MKCPYFDDFLQIQFVFQVNSTASHRFFEVEMTSKQRWFHEFLSDRFGSHWSHDNWNLIQASIILHQTALTFWRNWKHTAHRTHRSLLRHPQRRVADCSIDNEWLPLESKAFEASGGHEVLARAVNVPPTIFQTSTSLPSPLYYLDWSAVIFHWACVDIFRTSGRRKERVSLHMSG